MTVVSMTASVPLEQQISTLETQFARMFELTNQTPDIAYDERIDDLNRLQKSLKKHYDAIVTALS